MKETFDKRLSPVLWALMGAFVMTFWMILGQPVVAAILAGACWICAAMSASEPRPTLRDYFAAKAMQAMVTKSSGDDKTGGKKGVPLVAQYAYEFADAMLEARAKS